MIFYIVQYLKNFYFSSKFTANLSLLSIKDYQKAQTLKNILNNLKSSNLDLCVIPSLNLIYVPIEKAANSKIKRTLDELSENKRKYLNKRTNSFYGNPPAIIKLNPLLVHDALTSNETFKFSFVRNPYSRILSTWVDKFRNRPLVNSKVFHGPTPEIDTYLSLRKQLDSSLPFGKTESLSFDQFLYYATSTKDLCLDNHFREQSNIIECSGLKLNYTGRIESFVNDFQEILKINNLSNKMSITKLTQKVNSASATTKDFTLTDQHKKIIYKAYERDFSLFQYDS